MLIDGLLNMWSICEFSITWHDLQQMGSTSCHWMNFKVKLRSQFENIKTPQIHDEREVCCRTAEQLLRGRHGEIVFSAEIMNKLFF